MREGLTAEPGSEMRRCCHRKTWRAGTQAKGAGIVLAWRNHREATAVGTEGRLGRPAPEEVVGEERAPLSDAVQGEVQVGGRKGCRIAATGGVFAGKTKFPFSPVKAESQPLENQSP